MHIHKHIKSMLEILNTYLYNYIFTLTSLIIPDIIFVCIAINIVECRIINVIQIKYRFIIFSSVNIIT